MSQAISPSISCAHCGRAFTWKPSLAGRKGKCSCGHVVAIPVAPPAPPPPPPAEEDFDALYSMAESAPEPLPAAPAAPAARRSAVSLAYSTPPKKESSRDAFTDDRRDVYLPAALLVAGFIGVLVWAVTQLDFPPALLALVSLVTGVATAVKTLIIIGLAILFAPALGVSFGLLRTAVLKFAAILVFTDAALLWLEVIMEATGAIPTSGRYYVRGTATVNLLLAATIISLLTRFLFDMDGEDTAKIAFPMAFLSRLIGFGMKLLVLVILSIFVASKSANAPAVATPTTLPATGAAANAQSVPLAPAPPKNAIKIIETPADRDIAQRIAKNPFVRAASEERNQLGQARGTRELIDRIQVAGAVKMHIDIEGKRLAPTKAYIELPTDPAARARCFAEAGAVCESYGHKLDTTSDTSQRYLVVLFKQ